MSRPLATSLAWATDGADHLRGLMRRMGDDAFAAPSTLPGWSRAHVLSHVARNADAMINLLTWARTGQRTPAYASAEQRDADIAAGAKRSPAEIRADVVDSSDRLADVVRHMPSKAWKATVETRAGTPVPVTDFAWLRATETWVHAVDLDAGATFADLPRPLLAELIGEVATRTAANPGCARLLLVAEDLADARWRIGPPGADPDGTVSAKAVELAAWALGRSPGRRLRMVDGSPLPKLPSWT